MGEWSKNPGDPTNENYSILDRLESFRSAYGAFTLKLHYPELEGNIWAQTSNPVTKTEGGVDGYKEIFVPYKGANWGGLEYNSNSYSLIDGSVESANWFFAVGVITDTCKEQFPGPTSVDMTQVELYVLHTAACSSSPPTDSESDFRNYVG